MSDFAFQTRSDVSQTLDAQARQNSGTIGRRPIRGPRSGPGFEDGRNSTIEAAVRAAQPHILREAREGHQRGEIPDGSILCTVALRTEAYRRKLEEQFRAETRARMRVQPRLKVG